MTEIEPYKNSIVNDLFISTADRNYVVARWCFFQGVYRDFYWNSLHACEKYLKASLLLNGRSAVENQDGNFQHDIERLFTEVLEFSDDLFPHTLICPSKLNRRPWRNELLKDFVSRLNRQGDPNNRYAYFSIHQRKDDLFKLDGLVFLLRRLTLNLEGVYFDRSGNNDVTNRMMLANNPLYMPRKIESNLPKLSRGESENELHNTLHRLNFAFERRPEDLEGSWPGMYSENSVLYRLAGEALTNSSIAKNNEKAASIEWMLENIYFSKDVKKELKEAKQKLAD